MELSYDHACFVCGEKNPQGLKLKFAYDGKIIRTTVTPPDIYQGYPGILHGGITSTILDEVMSHTLAVTGQRGVTARLEVRFRQSIPIEKPVVFEAWLTGQKGKLVDTEAQALLEDGTVAAEATARFMIIKTGGDQ